MQRPESSRQVGTRIRFPGLGESESLRSLVSLNWRHKETLPLAAKQASAHAASSNTAQSAASSVPCEPAIYRSLALSALLQQLEPGRRYSILDLGQACGESINFWSQYPVKIFLPDFYHDLVTAAALSPEETTIGDSAWDALLPRDSDGLFDIILGWDLFNYLEPVQLACLIRLLSRVSHPGTFLFVLISTLQTIPVEPTRFRIRDHESLVYENSTPGTKPCPRYQPRDIKLMMAGYEVLVSFLLRHGMHEYLFVHQG